MRMSHLHCAMRKFCKRYKNADAPNFPAPATIASALGLCALFVCVSPVGLFVNTRREKTNWNAPLTVFSVGRLVRMLALPRLRITLSLAFCRRGRGRSWLVLLLLSVVDEEGADAEESKPIMGDHRRGGRILVWRGIVHAWDGSMRLQAVDKAPGGGCGCAYAAGVVRVHSRSRRGRRRLVLRGWKRVLVLMSLLGLAGRCPSSLALLPTLLPRRRALRRIRCAPRGRCRRRWGPASDLHQAASLHGEER